MNPLKQEIAKIPGYKILNQGITFKEFLVSLPISANQLLAKLKSKQILGGLDVSQFYKGYNNLLLIALIDLLTTTY